MRADPRGKRRVRLLRPGAGLVGAGVFAIVVLLPATGDARFNPLLLAAATRVNNVAATEKPPPISGPAPLEARIGKLRSHADCVVKAPVRGIVPADGPCKIEAVKPPPRPAATPALPPDSSCRTTPIGARQFIESFVTHSPQAVPSALQAEIGIALCEIHAGFAPTPNTGRVKAVSVAHPPDG